MDKIKKYIKLVKKLIVLVKPLSLIMVLAVIFGALGHIIATAIPALGAYELLNYASGGLEIKSIIITLGAFAVLRSLLRYFEQLCNHFVAFRILEIIRDRVFKALRRLAPAKMEGSDTGNLVSLITADIELLEVFYAHTISPVMIALIHSLFYFVLMTRINLAYGLALLAFHIIIAIIIPIITSNRGRDLGDRQRKELADLNSSIMDTFYGIEESTQYFHGPDRREQMIDYTQKLNRTSASLNKISGENQALSNSVILLGNISILVLGMKLFGLGKIDMAGLIVATIVFMSSFGPVSALSNLANNLLLTFASGERVIGLLEEEAEVPINEDGVEIGSFENMRFEGVNFSYGTEEVLQDFDLALDNGEILGISGRSGCGKSTIIKLMMRFYDRKSGTITKNGVDIRSIRTENLRSSQSYISQDAHLFNGTIMDNLKIAKEDASDSEVREACRKASIDEFIEDLPLGYESRVGDLLNSLSTGEKQRIALARGFLQDSDLLLLDEPTSNIDSLNEGIILKSIWEEYRTRAVVLVSHKKSTLRIADRLVEIDKKED